MSDNKTHKCIKGMDSKMQCKGFQYKEGETYKIPEEDVSICNKGFHAIDEDECPLSVFDYYPPCDQDGSPITDIEKAAADWKPAKPGDNFSKEALSWYKAVWLAAKERVPNAQSVFLSSLQVLNLRNDFLTIRFKTKEDAAIVSQFILDNDLAGDWKIDFRFSN